MTLKELSEYKKNLDELKEFRAFGMTPYQIGLALEGACEATRQLSIFHQHGIWLDNVHLFQKVETLDVAPLPINLMVDDNRCIFCGEEIAAQGSWDCTSCNQKGRSYV